MKVIVAGCVAVTVFDVGGALISKATGFAYEFFGIGCLSTFCAIGVFAARRGTLASAAAAGLIVALYDATVCWWIAWQIGPGRIDVSEGTTAAVAVPLTAMFAVSVNTAMSIGAAAVWQKLRERRQAGSGQGSD
ncbi:MAG TPA: hypothetical protein VGQ36_13805 [Thermoanaerobaculia bacterium]|nr:hypothetical protein [Thermoanaerobaculia bacterium]